MPCRSDRSPALESHEGVWACESTDGDPKGGFFSGRDPWEHQGGSIIEEWTRWLSGGQVLSALLLSTSFSEKYKGRNMQSGAQAELALPPRSSREADSETRRLKLLDRAGKKEAVAFIWLGDTSAGDANLYVAFSPMRSHRQLVKILGMGVSFEEEAPAGAAGEYRSTAGPESIVISTYIKRKLYKLWATHGLREKLERALIDYPGRSVFFSGISHGATLAQAASLQFACAHPDVKVRAITWNSLKWTDSAGSAFVERVLGSRMLPFVLSRQKVDADRHWDSVSGFPAVLAPMPLLVLMDADTGTLLPRCTSSTFPGTSNPVNPVDAHYALQLHFATEAIRATRKAMCLALQRSDVPSPTLSWESSEPPTEELDSSSCSTE